MTDIVDVVDHGAQGAMGVLGGMMVAGTAIAATGAMIHMMDRMGSNFGNGGGRRGGSGRITGQGQGRGRRRQIRIKQTGSKKCPLRQAYHGIKEGSNSVNHLVY